MPPSLIWAPDILMYNSASETFDGKYLSIYTYLHISTHIYNIYTGTYPTNVVVTSGGVCTYIPPGKHHENYIQPESLE